MTGADWIILIVILVSVVQAASAGFFHEAFGIGGLVFGYLFAAWEYRRLASWFLRYMSSEWLADIAGFLLILIGVMLVAGIAGRISRWVMREAGLSFLDRLLGAALGLVRGCLLITLVLIGMAAFTPTSKLLLGSQLAPYFLVMGRAAVWVAPGELRTRFYQGLDFVRREQQAIAPGASPGKQ